MYRTIAVANLLLTASALLCQEKPVQPMPEMMRNGFEAAIIPVKTLTGDSFNRLAGMLSVFNVSYRADDRLRTILVYAPPQTLAQIKKVVEELDQPGSEAAIGRNIEMTLTFLRCTAKPQASANEIPADLESAVKQLRAATQCKSVELWDAIPLRVQEGKETGQSIRLPGSLPEAPRAFTSAQIRIIPEAVTRKESGRYVRFSRLSIDLKVPVSTYIRTSGDSPMVNTQFNFMDIGLNTSGDFKEGQKAILGKLSGPEDGNPIFIVVSLKVLD